LYPPCWHGDSDSQLTTEGAAAVRRGVSLGGGNLTCHHSIHPTSFRFAAHRLETRQQEARVPLPQVLPNANPAIGISNESRAMLPLFHLSRFFSTITTDGFTLRCGTVQAATPMSQSLIWGDLVSRFAKPILCSTHSIKARCRSPSSWIHNWGVGRFGRSSLERGPRGPRTKCWRQPIPGWPAEPL